MGIKVWESGGFITLGVLRCSMKEILVAVEMRGDKAHEMVVSAIDEADAEYQARLTADDRYEGTLKSVQALGEA